MPPPPLLQGLRLLVVEDEAMVAMLVEDMLAELGHSVVGPAMRLDQALPLAREAEFDFAILDVNLGGQLSFPVAEVLRARGIPFIFATGYDAQAILPAYADVPRAEKPVAIREPTEAKRT